MGPQAMSSSCDAQSRHHIQDVGWKHTIQKLSGGIELSKLIECIEITVNLSRLLP